MRDLKDVTESLETAGGNILLLMVLMVLLGAAVVAFALSGLHNDATAAIDSTFTVVSGALVGILSGKERKPPAAPSSQS